MAQNFLAKILIQNNRKAQMQKNVTQVHGLLSNQQKCMNAPFISKADYSSIVSIFYIWTCIYSQKKGHVTVKQHVPFSYTC